MKADCWSVVAHTLADAGCRVVFGLPSDEPGLLDAAGTTGRMDVRVLGDQRVAACAAAGYAMASGAPVALELSSGPSFVNAMAGLLEAASLGLPVVVVTTSVPVGNVGRGAFQFVDQQAVAGSLVRWRFTVTAADRLAWAVRRAVALALGARPGVTMVELAHEVTTEDAEVVDARAVVRSRTRPADTDLAAAGDVLTTARRPSIVAGGGARGAAGLTDLAERLRAPVFTTAAGRGAVDERHERAFGLVGLYTTPPAEELLATADAVLVLGSRLEETARMRWTPAADARVIQVDQDPTAFGEGLPVDVALFGDVELTVAALLDRISGGVAEPAWQERQDRVAAAQWRWLDTDFDSSPVRLVLAEVSRVFGSGVVVVQDNGLHDIWSYHYPVLVVGDGDVVVCPGEQTMMGFGLAASVGAAIARPDRPSLVLCGDSAFRLSVNALAALREHELGVVVVVFDNAGYGWPRHLRAGLSTPDHVTTVGAPLDVASVATAFGGWGRDVRTSADVAPAFREAAEMASRGRFAVLRVPVPDHDVPAGVTLMQ